MENNKKIMILYSTFPSESQARKVVEHLLQKSLIACGNVFPGVQSMYLWKGQLQTESEVVCIMKSIVGNFEKIKGVYDQMHDYDTPCLISLEVSQVHEKYKSWLLDAIPD